MKQRSPTCSSRLRAPNNTCTRSSLIWRLQLHKEGDNVLFGRRGSELTKRFRDVRDAVIALRCRSAIISPCLTGALS